MTHDDVFSRLRMPFEDFAQLGHDDLFGRLRSAEAAALQLMTDLVAASEKEKSDLAAKLTAKEAERYSLSEQSRAVYVEHKKALAALDDARDQIAKLTNERDALLEKHDDKIKEERKAKELAADLALHKEVTARLEAAGVFVMQPTIADQKA